MITSKTNTTVKLIKRLQTRKGRKETGLFFVEGNRHVDDAIANYQQPIYIVQTQLNYDTHFIDQNALIVTDEIFSYLSGTKTPQGIIAVFEIPDYESDSIVNSDKILLLDHVQNSDNVGALIRTAVCAGFDTVLLTDGCADPYAPKAVRSSAGAVLAIKLSKVSTEQIQALKNSQFIFIGTHLDGVESEKIAKNKVVLVVGNEGSGISDDVAKLCDILIKIPICGNCESLNAAVAGSILMYKIIGY